MLRSRLLPKKKWQLLPLMLLLLSVALTFSLRGNVPQERIQLVDGAQYLGPIHVEAQFAQIGYRDNLRNWILNSSYPAKLYTNSTLTLAATFLPSLNRSSLSMEKQLNLNLTAAPIAYLHLSVSQHFNYSIQFFTHNIPLQVHGLLSNLTGFGSATDLQANLLLGSGALASNLTKVRITLYALPRLTPQSATLNLTSLEFLNYPVSQYHSAGQYHSAYLPFPQLELQNSSWKLDHINLGLQLNASPGAVFHLLIVEGATSYDAGTYEYNPISSDYEYTLLPINQLYAFPDATPPANSSIAIVTISGYLKSVHVDYVHFFLMPRQNTPALSLPLTTFNEAALYSYLSFFLFLLPIGTALVMYRYFRKGKKALPLALMLTIGLISRFALAPVTGHPYDTQVFVLSARAWFANGTPNAELGPTLPFAFFLYYLPYSFYALFLKLGLQDLHWFAQQDGMLETTFIKLFPILSDLVVCYLLLRLGRASKWGPLLASFYFLNPLAIYTSSVWGQYEAAEMALVLAAFLLLVKERPLILTALSLALAALLELFGLIPLGFLLLRNFFLRPLRPWKFLILLAPLALFLLYPPQLSLLYLIFLSLANAVPVLGLGSGNQYTVLSYLPQSSSYHLLLISLFLITLGFLLLRKRELSTVVSFSAAAILAIIVLGSQLVQWWDLLLPMGLLLALLAQKYDLGVYTLPFGALITFVTLSYTQGSGYMLVGYHFAMLPAIEGINNTRLIYVVSSTAAALGYLWFLVRKDSGKASYALLFSSLVFIAEFLLQYWLLGLPSS